MEQQERGFLQNQSASIKDGNDLISSKELKSFKNEFKIEEKEEGGAFLLTFFSTILWGRSGSFVNTLCFSYDSHDSNLFHKI